MEEEEAEERWGTRGEAEEMATWTRNRKLTIYFIIIHFLFTVPIIGFRAPPESELLASPSPKKATGKRRWRRMDKREGRINTAICIYREYYTECVWSSAQIFRYIFLRLWLQEGHEDQIVEEEEQAVEQIVVWLPWLLHLLALVCSHFLSSVGG